MELVVPGYQPLNGEEFRDQILAKCVPEFRAQVERQLNQDTRFKKAIVYHRLGWKVTIRYEALAVAHDELVLHGETVTRLEVEENRKLRAKVKTFENEWKAQTDKIRAESALLIEQAQRERADVERELSKTQAELLRLKAAQQGVEPKLLRDTLPQVAEFSVEQPIIEEPERVRQELEALEEKVGRAPEELVSVGTDGQPAPHPRAANRGAVVGGGQRPSAVVGKPR